MYTAALRGWQVRRPLRSLNEADTTTCKADRGLRTLDTWRNGRLEKAKSSVVQEKAYQANAKFNPEKQNGKRKPC